MSSAICFNLDQSKILLSGNGLGVAIYMYNIHMNYVTVTLSSDTLDIHCRILDVPVIHVF